MSFYYLDVINGAERGRRFFLPEGALGIGRGASNSISLHSSEKSVSGNHAIIYKSAARIRIQDLQSTNGTYVNDEKVIERELFPGDVVRFGKTGPELKLVFSEQELELLHPEVAVPEGVCERDLQTNTADEIISSKGGRPEKQPGKPFASVKGAQLSDTMAMEQKLMDKRVDTKDMQRLMKDGKKVKKIIGRGNLSQTQSNMLVSIYSASKNIRHRGRLILVSVIGVSVIVIIFFALRMLQYKSLVDKGLSLEGQLDAFEVKISEMNEDPDKNKEALASLIKKFEDTNAKLLSLKIDIREADYGKFYTDTVESIIDGIMARLGETDYHIPPQMVERVKHHLSVYSGRLKPSIARYLKRREIYFPMIREVLARNNLPSELAYVSMLESGFNPRALSHAGARGLWQFMKKTGRNYGLVINRRIDERLDPGKSTVAAAEYFKDLIAVFGGKRSVMLAMAAYNAGEDRVIDALRKIDDPVRDRDFWYIYRMGYLAEETNEYIPRILALMIISENSRLYGFDEGVADSTLLDAENDFVELNLKEKRD